MIDPLITLFELLINDRHVDNPLLSRDLVTYWQHQKKYSVTNEEEMLTLREHGDTFIIHVAADPNDMHAFITV